MPARLAIHFADVFPLFFYILVDLGATGFQELLGGSSTFQGLIKLC